MGATDTGEIAEVPEDDRLDVDEGEGSHAVDEETGDDTEGIDAIYDDPGEVVGEDLG